MDTSNILFICSGAFVGLENLVNSRIGKGVSMESGQRTQVLADCPFLVDWIRRNPATAASRF